MKRARILGLCLVAVLCTGACAAASASAAPEFLHLTKPLALTGFTGKSVGAATISDPSTGAIYKCSSETLEGEIEFGSTKRVEEVLIKFKGCTGEVAKTGKIEKKCTIKSPGQPVGTLKTKRLDGELDAIPVAEAADEVGLNLEPEVGVVVMVIEAAGCGTSAVVEGSIIGEVSPKGGPETLTKTLLSTTVGVKQKIQFLPSGAKDTLSAALTEMTLTSTVTLKFGEVLEVS